MGPRANGRVPSGAGSLLPAPRKRGGPPPSPHLPEEAAAGVQGLAAGKRQPGAGSWPSALAAPRGQEPGAGGPVRVVRGAQPPPSPAREPPRGGRGGARTCPAPCRSPGSGFTHLARAPRLPHVTARLRAPRHSGAGAGGGRETCSAAAAAPASSSGRRQRTCCAACHSRSGSAAPPQPHNMAAAASAGSRGAGREATGRAVDGPPARWRAPTRTPLRTRNWPGRGSSPPESRGRGPRGPGLHARLFPRGGPEALDPAALPGGVPTHLAPPPRGDMLGLASAFPATADPKVSEEGLVVSSTSLMQAPRPTPSPCGVLSVAFSPGSSVPLEWGWGGHRLFPPLSMGVSRASPSNTPEGLTFIVPDSRPFSVPYPPL
ncbi:translation initiation factor IF-2-like [Moschus berezovskii]|uniref:translation initiation factor IF-2-like n=1 Tax=Moschus berezovskii TaxID=68408 RepID=UPI00244473FC|nr:translation initiation factor IF-2-like [Moschus berezovskii]